MKLTLISKSGHSAHFEGSWEEFAVVHEFLDEYIFEPEDDEPIAVVDERDPSGLYDPHLDAVSNGPIQQGSTHVLGPNTNLNAFEKVR